MIFAFDERGAARVVDAVRGVERRGVDLRGARSPAPPAPATFLAKLGACGDLESNGDPHLYDWSLVRPGAAAGSYAAASPIVAGNHNLRESNGALGVPKGLVVAARLGGYDAEKQPKYLFDFAGFVVVDLVQVGGTETGGWTYDAKRNGSTETIARNLTPLVRSGFDSQKATLGVGRTKPDGTFELVTTDERILTGTCP